MRGNGVHWRKGEPERVLKVSGYRHRGSFHRKRFFVGTDIGEAERETSCGVDVV